MYQQQKQTNQAFIYILSPRSIVINLRPHSLARAPLYLLVVGWPFLPTFAQGTNCRPFCCAIDKRHFFPSPTVANVDKPRRRSVVCEACPYWLARQPATVPLRQSH